MSASDSSYRPVLFVQLLMLVADLSANVAAPLLYQHNTVQLMLYVLQDTSTLMALIIMFISFFSTFVFQAGLISLLVGRFQATIYATVLYLVASVACHSWLLSEQWGREKEYIWTVPMLLMFIVQRTLAVVYYYTYKRSALMLGDPRFYRDSPWLREQLRKH